MKLRCKKCGWECEDIADMGMHLAFGHKLVDRIFESEEEKIRETTFPEYLIPLKEAIDRAPGGS